jgi:hypothetical protein
LLFKIHLLQQHNQLVEALIVVEWDERLVEMISNDVSLLYVMPYYQYEFFANNVDRNNRNKQNFDRINHQQLSYIMNKIDIVNVVRFEDV